MNLKQLDGCVFPRRLVPILEEIKHEAGLGHAEVFTSGYRGRDAAPLLNRLGKHTQYQLVHATAAQRAAWGILGTPNPAGQSTHELFSDDVAYAGPIGRKLDWWQCGLDIDDAYVDRMIAAAARLGLHLFRPYAAGVEHHHANFRSKPRLRLRRRAKRSIRHAVQGGRRHR
jgi:hypothetical protein